MIDFLYIFNFNKDNIDNALKRFKCSIESIKTQDVNICISNNSPIDIQAEIKTVCDNFKYIHKQYDGHFSRAHAINFGVKQLVTTEYFILSDIDLVYQENHVKNLVSKIEDSKTPIRVVHYNYNINEECYSSDYNHLVSLKKANIGYAHGNSLIHLKSFYDIQGYDEEMIGYGPEDSLCNERISKINKVIYCEDHNLITAHIYHPRFQMIQFQENHKIFDIKMKSLNSGSPEFIVANRGKEWGVI